MGADELRGLEGRDHRFHEGAGPRAWQPQRACNVVAPGYVETRLTEVCRRTTPRVLENTPLGRLGEPEDVAGAVRFLCSEEASFITGEVLLVDGGLGM